MMPTLVLVVPCYNEAERLREEAFLDFLHESPTARLLFVDDGSTDGTFAALQRIEAREPSSVSLIRLERNSGKAEAVRRGLLTAFESKPDLIGFWDADLSTPLCAVSDFLRLAADRPDIDLFIGSRVLLMGRDIRRRAMRHYLGRVFATAASLALRLPIYDTQCGAKVFRATATLAHVLSVPFRSAWIFDVELIARYLQEPVETGGTPRASRLYELSVPAWHDVPGSKLRIGDYFRAMVELVGVWRDRRSGAWRSDR
jgi:dolichyl-phosphate beta-glucosyltransferase